MKSVRSVSFGVACCCGGCLTILAFGTATVRVTAFVSGFAIFLASATTMLLVLSINSNAANWDGGAIPDQSNVATAIIPTGYSVIYNSDVVGQISNTTIRNNGVVEFNERSSFIFFNIR